MTTAVMLTACSGSGGSDGGGVADRNSTQLGRGSVRLPEAAPTNQAANSGKSAGSSTDKGAPLGVTSLIKSASMQVEIAKPADVARQADAAGQIAVADGGSVFADDRTAGEHGSARLTLKVPPDTLTAVLAKLSALGKEVTRQSSSQDVTSQVADVNSRVESARGSLARLRALYSHATKVGDVITIEGEIAQREADLESLEAQQRTLEAQTSMATVQLYLSVSGTAPAATHHDKRGFLGGLSRGWHSFTSAATSIATGVGAALPFLVLVLLIGAAAWKLWPRRAQTPPAPIAE
jgi:hypothetical protein